MLLPALKDFIYVLLDQVITEIKLVLMIDLLNKTGANANDYKNL